MDAVKENQTNVSRETFASRFAELFDFANAAEIGRKIGVPHATVSNYLRGRLPSPDVLIKIARETNVSLNWLLTGEGSKWISDEGSNFIIEPEINSQPYKIFDRAELELFVRRIVREELESTIKEEQYDDAQPRSMIPRPLDRFDALELLPNNRELALSGTDNLPEEVGLLFKDWDKLSDEDQALTLKQIKEIVETKTPKPPSSKSKKK